MAYTPRNAGQQPKQDPSPKPINPFPLIAMLIIIVFVILWLNGVFA